MKTHEQKAKELIKQFEPLFKDLYLKEYISKKCKQSALICVNNMIDFTPKTINTVCYMKITSELYQVKDYLERL